LCQWGLPRRLSFLSSSLSPPASLIYLNTEAQQCAAEPDTFRRRATISSRAHPSNSRNSRTARYLFLTSIVTFRFWQFRNGHRNPPCGVIVFECGIWTS
jgi:hypothetical protein